MFRNREEGARQLAELLRSMTFRDPLLLAISAGGMVVGSALSRLLGMELDVILCRKLRSRANSREVGAVSENGTISIDRTARGIEDVTAESLIEERTVQLAEITRQRSAFRTARAPAKIANRSVLVTDDGIVTGSTMIAALDGIRRSAVFELIAVVPVAPRERLPAVRRRCDRIVCVSQLDELRDLEDCYEEFSPVSEEDAVRLLKDSIPPQDPIRDSLR